MPKMVTGHYRDPQTGETSTHTMRAVALREAMERHPAQWSKRPWGDKPAAAAAPALQPTARRKRAPFKHHARPTPAGPHVGRKGGINSWAVLDGDRILFGPVGSKSEADAWLVANLPAEG